MFNYVVIVSHPRSMMQVSFAVLLGVLSSMRAAFLYRISNFSITAFQASGMYQASVPYPITLLTHALIMFAFMLICRLGSLLSTAIVAWSFCLPFLHLSRRWFLPLSFPSSVNPRYVGWLDLT